MYAENTIFLPFEIGQAHLPVWFPKLKFFKSFSFLEGNDKTKIQISLLTNHKFAINKWKN